MANSRKQYMRAASEVVLPLSWLLRYGVSLLGTESYRAFFWLGRLPVQGQHCHYTGNTASSCFRCASCKCYKWLLIFLNAAIFKYSA